MNFSRMCGIAARPWTAMHVGIVAVAASITQGCSGGAEPSTDNSLTADAGATPAANVTRHGDGAAPLDSRQTGSGATAPAVDPQTAPAVDPQTAPATAEASAPAGTLPSGWLYTMGNQIYVSDGAGGGSPWMGRGVNIDDLFLCGYNDNLQDSKAPQAIEGIASSAVSDWGANFVRVSLGMASYPTHVSWLTDSTYKTTMTQVVSSLGAANAHVLVTLRTDDSFVGQSPSDPEPTGVPSTGTDAVYVALVDSFANAGYVMFGLSNEPGGNQSDESSIVAAMTHAVSVIRAEEDRLGVPHHLVSVQGAGYTSDVSFYSKTPLAFDNVVYEVHGYPPATSSYTYSNIPVIIGEYGSLKDSASFFADVEAKHIPNLAWDLEPFSNCAPDLVTVNDNATSQSPTDWGNTVKKYLASP
ncbi:MAG: cellulase family glycosylhydrolase [Polyangiaceae bacterium]|nr:cellulase family glycosylhydrolase [Polyangiaceae bacterium]